MAAAVAMRRILCPTDFSELSQRALAHAVALARRRVAEVIVVHVHPPVLLPGPDIPDFATTAPDPEARARRIEQLGHFSESARRAGVPVRACLLEGDPGREIVAQARALDADVIVMATHGRVGLEKLAVGSVTEKVLGRAPCPVLTVSGAGDAPEEADGLRRILCAVDLGLSSARTLESAVTLAREAEGELTLLHVVEGPDKDQPGFNAPFDVPEYRGHMMADARKELRAAVAEDVREALAVREIVTEGNPVKEILRVAAEERADLIVIGAHGFHPIDVLFSGSTVRKVVRQARCPVLTIRPGGQPAQRTRPARGVRAAP